MLYERYERRVRKVFKIRKQIFRFRKLIYAITAVIALLSVAFVSTRGIVTSTDIPETLGYGDSFSFNSNALFSTISYEYRLEGQTKWQTTKPTMAGTYEARIVTQGGFGRRQTIKKFEIQPKPIAILVTNLKVEFGTDIQIDADLSFEDTIDTFTFTFENTGLKETKVLISDVVIKNKEGLDVSSNYNITNTSFNITFIPRVIQISLIDQTFVYNGSTQTSTEINLGPNQLIHGHKVVLKTSGNQLDTGLTPNEITEVRIFDTDNVDVTTNYNVETKSGLIEVVKRPITIQTDSKTMTYDGSTLSSHQYEIIEGHLVDGHRLDLVFSQSLTFAGSVDNAVSSYTIYDESENDVTYNYDITFDYGKLNILQRPLKVQTHDQDKIYDGISLLEKDYTILDGTILDNQVIDVKKHTEVVSVSIVENILELYITEDGLDITHNYDITYIYGHLEVISKEITVTTSNAQKVYDDIAFFNEALNMTEGSILNHHNIKVITHTEITDVSLKDNILDIKIFDGDMDVTNNYDITYIYGTLEITLRRLHVAPQYTEKVYDGFALEQDLYELTKDTSLASNHVLKMVSKGTDNQVDVATYINSIIDITIHKQDIDVTHNYDIVYEEAFIQILPRQIKIKPSDADKVYDGLSFNSNDYDLLDETSIVEGHEVIIVTTGTLDNTFVDIYINEIISIVIMLDDMDVTDNYDINLETGLLIIEQRYILVQPENGTKIYDGTDFNIDLALLLEKTTLVNGHAITLTTTGTLGETFIGIYENYITDIAITDGTDNVTGNYQIVSNYGTLEITPKEITVKPEDDQKIYDGLSFNHSTPVITVGALVPGQIIYIETLGTQNATFVDIYENHIITTKIFEGDIETTVNYQIQFEIGYLEITHKHITIETQDKTKVYDGHLIIETNIIYQIDELVPNNVVHLDFITMFSDVGQKENIITVLILDQNDIVVTDNYDITYIYGALEVTPRPITIKPLDATKTYDDKDFDSKEALISGDFGLVFGHEVFLNTTGTKGITDVGTYVNEINSAQIFEGAYDVTNNYDITFETGLLTITPRVIEIESLSITRMYDGTPLFIDQFEINSGSFVETHTYEVTLFTSIIDVDIVDNYIEITIYNIEQKDVTYNYHIEYTYGTIEVFQRPILVMPEFSTKTYDDLSFNHSVAEVIGAFELIDGHTITITTSGTGEETDVGYYSNTILSINIFDDTRDVTHNYDPSFEIGVLYIDYRYVTIQSLSDEKVYDGTALFNLEFIIVENTFVEWHETNVITYSSITDVGLITNDITLEVYRLDGKNVTHNYMIHNDAGTLEIFKREIQITTHSGTKIYDGEILYEFGHEVTLGTLVSWHETIITDYAWLIDVDKKDNVLTVDIFDGTKYVTHNYDISYIYGVLEVTHRYSTFISQSKTKIYDGSPLMEPNLIYDAANLAPNQLDIKTYMHYITDVGVEENKITVMIQDIDGNDVTHNYKIDYIYGTLEVTPRPLTLKLTYETKVYDGMPFVSNNYEIINETGLASNQEIVSILTTGSGMNTFVGTYINEILEVIIKEGLYDVTSNYDLEFIEELIDIKPRPITIKPEDSTYQYEDLALDHSIGKVISELGLVLGHKSVLETTGSNGHKDVGNYLNEILSVTIIDDAFVDVTSNYDITNADGYLEIVRRFVEIQTLDAEKIYDGDPLFEISFDIIENSFVTWHKTVVTDFTSIINVGNIQNQIVITIYDEKGIDVSYNYHINYQLGELRIIPRKLTIETMSNSKVYDGTVLYDAHYAIPFGTLVKNQHFIVEAYTTILHVGTITNKLDIRIYDDIDDVTDNYEITYEEGILEILPRELMVQTLSDEKVYDGKSFRLQAYEIINGSLAENETLIVFSDTTIKDVGLVLNELILKVFNPDGDDVSNNYMIDYVYGTLEITPRHITIETQSDSKMYDGSPLTQIELLYEANSFAEDHTYSYNFISMITTVGIIENKITVSILDASFEDVSNNYNIFYIYGKLEVTLRPITIKPVNAEKTYDDLVYNYSIAEVISDIQLVLGDYIELITTGSGNETDAGTYINEIISISIYDQFLNDVADNYDITLMAGELVIAKRPIHIETASDLKVYDGTPLSNLEFSIIEGSLVAWHIPLVMVYVDMIDVGKLDNELKIEIFNEAYKELTHNYDITYTFGTLEILPRPITIKTASAEKIYDATMLYDHGYEIILGELVEGHDTVLNGETLIINVKKVSNRLNFLIFDGLRDVTFNYEITYDEGTLEILPKPIKVRSTDATKIYDGFILSAPVHEIIEGTLIYGHTSITSFATEISDADIVDNIIKIDIYDVDNTNVTRNYDVTYDYGTLEIKQRLIEIETGNHQKVYDGTPLKSHSYTLHSGTIVLDHFIQVDKDTQITNVGTVDNVLVFKIFSGMDDVTKNYDIKILLGSLEVTPRYIHIKPEDLVKIYNGEIFGIDNVEFLDETSLVNDQQIYIATTKSNSNVGIYDIYILSILISEGAIDVTDNYVYDASVGKLEITPKPITIRAEDAVKEFDSLPLTSTEHYVRIGELVDGHESFATTSGSQTEIGYSDNDITGITILNSLGEDMTLNYDITVETGLLEVTPRYVEISTASDKKNFDGTELFNHYWEITSGSIAQTHTYEIIVTGWILNPGKVFNNFDIEILNQDGIDVKDNYVIKQNIGILEVVDTRHKITIKSASEAKLYDGLPLTNDHWELVRSKLLDGHDIEITVTGSITEPGEDDNSFIVDIYDEHNVNVTHILYNITYHYGTLIVFDDASNGNNEAKDSKINDKGDPDQSNTTKNKPLFRIFSEVTETLYLRERSMGDYNTSGFDAPMIYEGDGWNPLQMPSDALDDKETYLMKLEALSTGLSYYMPYYSVDGFGTNQNDIFVQKKYGMSYEINYKSYTKFLKGEYNHKDSVYETYESLYKTFVYDNYLTLPETTKAGMIRIAASNGLDVNSPTLITDIQNYILGAAIYNLAYKPYPTNVDKAVYFLEHLYEGICQHFAMAATVMYRAMGIPARYTIGYVVDAEADTWVEVTNGRYHAWVEIYMDGFGWIPIEVTPGGAEGDGPGGRDGSGGDTPGMNPGEGPGDGEEPGDGDGDGDGDGGGSGWGKPDNRPSLIVYSGNASKHYDGTPLSYDFSYHEGDLLPGHRLNVEVLGEITQVGQVDNKMTVQILNMAGEDVTKMYKLVQTPGVLVIVPNNIKPIIEFQIFDIRKTYTGQTYRNLQDDYYIVSDNLPSGYYVELEIVGEITEVGIVRSYINQGTLRIYDSQGIDVTSQFNVVTYYGSLQVIDRQLTIMTETVEKFDDGTPLSAKNYYITQGSLAPGHTIEVVMETVNDAPGSKENAITNIIITDEDGRNVTKNYNINIKLGFLTILVE